ncbi:MAG: sigma-54-dependent Fis family transcriptional regulator [Bacteroidetes bacterium]|nr:sigma-54-dependent Fis family transcriptional regulator [Bacteroidota bacterium]
MDAPLVYIVDDDYSLRRLLEFTLKSWGYASQTFANGELLLQALDEQTPEIVLMDHMMPGLSGLDTLKTVRDKYPDLPVIMLSAQGKIDVAVELMRAGATDYFTKPVDLKRLQFALNNAMSIHKLKDKVRQLQETLESTVRFDNIISSSGVMQNVLKLVDKARNSDINVLIEGESGTGKELIARAIHFNGNRKDRPFVVINCAAIPRELLESELFGHERGSFTGAVDRKIGKFEAAHTGTIFLDEIGELDMTLQAKLLRVIQTKQFERIGGLETYTSDARIISATNRDLLSMAEQRSFREDLYYRLCTFPIKLPSLRERPSEIPLLAEHFLNQFAARENKPGMTMGADTLALLQRYPWPGNVRELQSIIERAVLLADGDSIGPEDLPQALRFSGGRSEGGLPAEIFSTREDVLPLEKIKEMAIQRALRLFDGNMTETARALSIGRTTLYDLIKKYDIRP